MQIQGCNAAQYMYAILYLHAYVVARHHVCLALCGCDAPNHHTTRPTPNTTPTRSPFTPGDQPDEPDDSHLGEWARRVISTPRTSPPDTQPSPTAYTCSAHTTAEDRYDLHTYPSRESASPKTRKAISKTRKAISIVPPALRPTPTLPGYLMLLPDELSQPLDKLTSQFSPSAKSHHSVLESKDATGGCGQWQ